MLLGCEEDVVVCLGFAFRVPLVVSRAPNCICVLHCRNFYCVVVEVTNSSRKGGSFWVRIVLRGFMEGAQGRLNECLVSLVA